jgi:protein-S-isoprenylcysteine O-methyltransferase Ste14
MSRSFDRLFAWLGGAMFIGSLAFCAYSYLIRWSALGEPVVPFQVGGLRPTRSSISAAVFDGGLMLLFAVHHSIFARDRVKAWLSQVVPQRLLRSVYVWTASLLLVGVCLLWVPIGGDVYHTTGWRAVLHACVQLIGLSLIASSVRSIDALELAGIRQRPSSEALQSVGPYRLVRHPLYLGWILAVFGAAHMTGDRLVFAAVTTAYILVAIPWEERALASLFGGEYQIYARRVRWRLIPYIY